MGKIPAVVAAVDEAGHEICRYTRNDVDGSWQAHVPEKTTGSYARYVMDVFLPAGYPHSVTPDYTAYQVYDSLQAFSSAIAGLLASRAVLQGFGVGGGINGDDGEGPSATAAVLLTVLQESTGRLATILFAHRLGQAIEPECKTYRFLADILNDAGMLLDLLSPALGRYSKVLALCAAGVLRALCGVSAGAAKASLSAHFARNGNLAELNAKDGSQETVISLMGMLAGSLFVRVVTGRAAVWFSMLVLIATHLGTNYLAVRAVKMRSLNRQRATLVHLHYLKTGSILRPDEVAQRESILTWRPLRPVRFATAAPRGDEITGMRLEDASDRNFFLVSGRDLGITIFLKAGATSRDALAAWFMALSPKTLDEEFWKALQSSGWNLDIAALETGTAIRITTDEEAGTKERVQKNAS